MGPPAPSLSSSCSPSSCAHSDLEPEGGPSWRSWGPQVSSRNSRKASVNVIRGWLCLRRPFPLPPPSSSLIVPPFPSRETNRKGHPPGGTPISHCVRGTGRFSGVTVPDAPLPHCERRAPGVPGRYSQGFSAPASTHRPRTRTAARSRVPAMSKFSCTQGRLRNAGFPLPAGALSSPLCLLSKRK